MILGQPVPGFFRRGSQFLASSTRTAQGTKKTITEEETRITSSVLSTEVVASGNSQEHARNRIERRNGEEGATQESHNIGQDMTHDGAVLLLRTGIELGEGAQSEARQEPACSTTKAVNGVARLTTAGFALPALPAVVLTLRVPTGVSPKTTLAVFVHDGLFILTVEHTIDPTTKDTSKHAQETQDGGHQKDDRFQESVFNHVALLEDLAVATNSTAGAANYFSHQAEVRYLTGDSVTPALSVLFLTTSILFVHLAVKKELTVVECHTAGCAATC